MEVTTSSGTVNNLITTVVLNLNFQVLINLVLYSAAATTGVIITSKLLTLVFEELVRELRYKWITRYNDKRELAKEVIKILTEGSTTGWSIQPRNIEHIYFIANLLEATDPIANNLFNIVISSWSINAFTQKELNRGKDTIKFCAELQSRAQTASTELKKMISKWH